MTNKKLVSVIIIFLNGEQFIEEAIASVFAQTYEHWELVLVDDGSTDASSQIAQRYAQQYPEKVRYLEHEQHQNRGMSASRNLGVRAANGEYIAFLDADDIYLPQKLERQVAILDAQPQAAMVYGATQHWFSWTGRAEDQGHDYLRKLGVPTDTLTQPPELLVRYLQHRAWTPGTCGVLIRRDAIVQVGGFEEQFNGLFEDQAFFYKLALHTKVFVESGSWDRYRQHPGSWCETSRKVGLWSPGRQPNAPRGTFLNWLERYFAEQQVTDAELWSALRTELWPYRHPVLYRLSAFVRQAKQLMWAMKRAT